MTIKDLKLSDIGFKLFLFFLFVCPIFYDPSKVIGQATLRINQEQFFQLGACALFAIVLLENIYLCALLLWSIVLYAYYGFPPIGGNYVMNIFLGCVIFQISYKLISSDNVDRVFKAILWLGVANLFWLCLQFLQVELIFMREGQYTTDLVALMGLKCFMGMFFALCVPILAYFNWKIAPVLFIPIYFSESSVAIVGGAVSLLFVIFFKSKKAFYSILTIFLVAGSLYVANDTKAGMFEDRYKMWKVVLRDAFKHPVMGWGLDSFRNAGTFKPFIYMKNAMTGETKAVSLGAIKVYNETGVMPPMPGFIKQGDALDIWDNPHNEYIQIFFEFGAIGVLIIGFLCSDLIKKFRNAPEIISIAAVFIVYLIISTGQFPFHVVRLGFLAPVMLAAYYKINEEYKQGELIYGS